MSLFLSIFKKPQNRSKEEDPFNNLPQEIIIGILSRLPIGTIPTCKRVCKSWRDLVKRPDFATSHLSKHTSTSCIALSQLWYSPMPYNIFRFVDEQSALESLLLSTDWPTPNNKPMLHSSANGLLFLLKKSALADSLFICNPIKSEYIELELPHPRGGRLPYTRLFGFGVSKISGKYKLVRIIYEDSSSENGFPRRMCEVYTVGTGRLRSISPCKPLDFDYYNYDGVGVFVNGNLHWLAECDNRPWISCLDLEFERFSSFSPPLDFPLSCDGYRSPWLHVLGDRLCLSNNNARTHEFAMWSMKEYGDEKLWSKEINIKTEPVSRRIFPLHHLEDGEILFADSNSADLLCYSNATKAMRKCGLFRECYCSGGRKVVTFTPSFDSLQSKFRMENVVSF